MSTEIRPPASNTRMLGLDILRMIAIFLVLGRHMGDAPADLPRPVQSFFKTWQRGGWLGVDLFFVLSGFLVSGLLFTEYRRRGELSVLRFYVRRGWKIYPAFFFLIAVTVLARIAKSVAVSRRDLFSEVFFLQNYLGYMLGHTWSLAVEEHFYLMLPLLLAGLLWIQKRGCVDPFRPIVVIIAFIGLVLLVLRMCNSWMRPTFSHRTHLYPTHLRIDSLFFGVLIAYAYHFHNEWFKRAFGAQRWWLLLGGCGLLVPAFMFQLEESPFLWTGGLTMFYLGSGAILTGVVLSEAPKSRVAVGFGMLGAYSYSIYLWHVPVNVWFIPILEHFLSRELHFSVRAPIYIVGSLGLGVIMAKLIEVPALRLRDRWFPARSENAEGARSRRLSAQAADRAV